MQDSIVAEDLGRFPDDNVADSLSHITGITLQRTRGGEGQYVNVRGLGPEFSIVTLNGPHSRDRRRRPRIRIRRAAFRDHRRRRRLQVRRCRRISKAALAARSISPRRGRWIGRACAARLSVEGDYNDLSENTGYKASAVFSNTFAEDRMGLMLTAVYQDTEVRSDAVHEFFITPDSPGEFDANGDGDISADESDLLGLCCTSFGARIQQKEAQRRHRRVAMAGRPTPSA